MRLQVSFDPVVYDDLTYLSERLRISRSAFLSVLVADALRDLRALMEQVPPQPTDEDVRRLRGRSVEVISREMREYMAMLSEGAGRG